MQDLMREQMEKAENVEKPHWLSEEKSFIVLADDLQVNLNKLTQAVRDRIVADAWRRAANAANFAWMIADRLEKQVAADNEA
jgi:hypothetical protein